ncbi:Alpha-ribazole-5'-phosphate phosphatase [hydrothermal vent metagenome]|uniref:Alpha-ribazole-5'-phosphate phosphatase n=1 Tax=hydrothermal vent metagenome TaxID=652676 RepID=A0A3B0UWG4_9ZZZZ
MKVKATRLYLARHGQVVGHDEFRYHGHFDVALTDKGLEQSERLSLFLADKEIKAVYSSDLQRSVIGAGKVASALGLSTAGELVELRELHLGRWEGLTRAEAVAKFPEDDGFTFQDLANSKIEGGESLTDLGTRVMPAIEGIIKENQGRHICVVAHGGVNRVILMQAMGLPVENFFRIEQDYGGLNIIDYFSDGRSIVKMLNGGPNQEMGRTIIY